MTSWHCSLPWGVADMQDRYARNIPALSPEACALLREKTVAVIGCGGLGGYLAELLARIGVGRIRAVDGDVFERSNLNRQLLCREDLLGRSKAEEAANRVKAVNSQVSAEAVPEFLTADNASRILSGCDAVLDGLDSIAARRVLANACRRDGIPYVYGAISGWVAQAALVLPQDLLPEILFSEGSESTNKSVLSFTPALCAALQASLCVKYLTGQHAQSGTVYYFDLLNQEYEQIPLG